MTNVLIPTDFSENAWNAIAYALQFFKEEPSNFYLLHVSIANRQDQSNGTAANGFFFEMKNTVGITDKLTELKIRIKESYPNTNHRFYALQEHTFFVEGIKRTVVDKKIDFIVMGTKGATGLKEVTIGSRTGEVITRVKCPVLVIPENAEYTEINEIVFPTDFNSYFKNKILLTLAEVMAINDARLHVLNVNKNKKRLSIEQRENKGFLEDFMEDKPHQFHFLAESNIEDGLARFEKENKIDMIAMVAKNVNFFHRLLFQPSVAKISYHTHIPFLVLHE